MLNRVGHHSKSIPLLAPNVARLVQLIMKNITYYRECTYIPKDKKLHMRSNTRGPVSLLLVRVQPQHCHLCTMQRMKFEVIAGRHTVINSLHVRLHIMVHTSPKVSRRDFTPLPEPVQIVHV